MLKPGTLIDNRYRLGRLLGQGGMAVVYRAHDETLDRPVAIKILRNQYASDDDFVRSFQQEARNAASLAHQAIAPVFDIGLQGEQQYVVMQLVDGPDLERVLADRGRLPVGEAIRIVSEVADALQVAHDRGIIHRDVKPRNVLLTSDGDVRIVDFGIARALGDARTTSPGLLLGSLPYCSPEQLLGEAISPASDVYSLGIVLYELLTGRRPFDAAPVAVALQRLREGPRPPSEVAPDIPVDLDRLVLRAIERRPEARYASARELADAIRSWWQAERRQQNGERPSGTLPTLPSGSAVAPTVAAAWAGGGASRSDAGRPVPAASRSGGVHAAAPHRARDGREDHRRSLLPLWLIPVAAILVVVAAFWTVRDGLLGADRGGVLGTIGSPSASSAAVVPSATSSSTASAAPVASPTLTPEPTLPPSPPPTPDPTPPPTPEPTTRPTAPPAAPPPASGSPAAVVARFYDLVESHEFDAAASLWTARMRRQHPPDGYIDGRFSRTTGINLRRNEVIALDARAGTAVVAVDLTEHRTVAPSPRRFVGRWDLVLTDRGWRMDRPHF